MVSRSYSNLLDLASGDAPIPSFGRERKRFPRVATVAGVLTDLDDENNDGSDAPSSVSLGRRMIIVGNQLPLRALRSPDSSGGWCFSWDEDSLLLQLKDGLGEGVEVIYVGSLKEEIEPSEQDDVAQTLLETFKCVPAFIPPDLFTKFYHGFCKQHLWPLFHYMLPLSPDLGGRFDRSLWQAYVSVNKIFADKVKEVISPEDDYVWVHDYHLMVLPTFLRKIFNRVKLGFFLHSPFPSSEIYRTLPVRDELLRALLNSDLIGFHTFDYARHFLSCCSRMLGLSYQSKRGYIGLEYFGRTVSIKILPVGIHIECCLVTAVRDGMNLIPYEYIICRQGSEKLDETLGRDPSAPRKSMLVLSEFIGCSPSLSGAIRVNPWNIDAVAEAMNSALVVPELEKQMRHEKHHRYVSTHDVAYWAHSFLQDLERACRDHVKRRCWGFGFGLGFRVIALDPNFRKISVEHIVSAYKRTNNRVILLDYDGTMTLPSSIRTPNMETVGVLNSLCTDPKNVVFLVSGRDRETLTEWFSSCEKLGIAAEHGYFMRRKNGQCGLHFPHVQPVVVLVLVRGVISHCSVLYPSLWNNSLMAFDIAESNSTVVVL
ncbi:hypothetical protein D5086_001261 [Populus alba]|uniref:Uncharacterized protein n=1 Tax=Populus alba TaxID=43335 RepID=A0ACC4CYA6_POPAL